LKIKKILAASNQHTSLVQKYVGHLSYFSFETKRLLAKLPSLWHGGVAMVWLTK
jgi:hypothetical protein